MTWTLADFRRWWISGARHRWLRLRRELDRAHSGHSARTAPPPIVSPHARANRRPLRTAAPPAFRIPAPRNLTNFGDMQ
jgi:hypothetical protein